MQVVKAVQFCIAKESLVVATLGTWLASRDLNALEEIFVPQKFESKHQLTFCLFYSVFHWSFAYLLMSVFKSWGTLGLAILCFST